MIFKYKSRKAAPGSILLFLFLAALPSWSTVLEGIKVLENRDGPYVKFEFSSLVPEYNLNSNSDGNITLLVYQFKECSTTVVPNLEILRPVQHIEADQIQKEGITQTQVTIYLEKKIPVRNEVSQNNLSAVFSWLEVNRKEEPSILKSMAFRSNEENSLSVKSEFDRVPPEKFVFLSMDKKKVIVSFLNTKEEADVMEPMHSNLVNKIQTKRGIAKNGQGYTKLVFHANQELLMDVAEETNRFFMDFYGVSGQKIDPNAEPDLEENLVKYERSGEGPEYVKPPSTKKWWYLGLGTGLMVGGAAAGYFYFSDDGADKAKEIKEIDVLMPDTP